MKAFSDLYKHCKELIVLRSSVLHQYFTGIQFAILFVLAKTVEILLDLLLYSSHLRVFGLPFY